MPCLVALAAGCSLLSPRSPAGGTEGAAAQGPDAPAADSVEGTDTTRPDPAAGAATDTLAGAGDRGEGDEQQGPGAAGAEVAYPYGPVYATDVELLRAMGPVFTPYDRSPVLEPGHWLRGLLEATLLPVIDRYDFSPNRQARYWILVDRRGEVADVVLQLTSGSAAFDQAARAAAEKLRYIPARRGGRPVPVWVLEPISLLMR